LNGVILARRVRRRSARSPKMCDVVRDNSRVREATSAEVLFPSVLRALAVTCGYTSERRGGPAQRHESGDGCFVVRPFAFTTDRSRDNRRLAVPRAAIAVASEKVAIDCPFLGTDTYRYGRVTGRATFLLLPG